MVSLGIGRRRLGRARFHRRRGTNCFKGLASSGTMTEKLRDTNIDTIVFHVPQGQQLVKVIACRRGTVRTKVVSLETRSGGLDGVLSSPD